MNAVLKKLSLKKQYLFFYIALLAVPVLIVSSGLLLSFRELRSKVIQSNYSALDQTSLSVETAITSLSDLTAIIEADPTLSRYSLKTSPIRAIETLNKLRNSNASVSNIVLHEKGSDQFFTSSGSFYNSDLSFQNFIRNYAISESEKWLELFENTAGLSFYSGQADSQSTTACLFVFYPITSYEGESLYSGRNAAYLIPQSYLQEIFLSSQTKNLEMVVILNKEMETLSHTPYSSTEYGSEELENILGHLLSDKILTESPQEEPLSIGNNLIFIKNSSKTGLVYLRILSREKAYDLLYRLTFFIVGLFLLTVLAGVGLILFGMKRHYAPIHQLAEKVTKKLNKAEGKASGDAAHNLNELFQLERAFDRIFAEDLKNTDLFKDENRHGIIDHFISVWICGNIKSREAFDNILSNTGLSLPLHYFTVFGVALHPDAKESRSADYKDLYHGLREVIEKRESFVLIKDLLFDHKLLLVINSNKSDPKFYYSLAHEVSDYLKSLSAGDVSIGIGGSYNSFDQLGRSYLDSTNALDYSIIYGRDCIVTQGMCRNDFARSNYPSADLNALSTAIFTQNKESAFMAMDRLKEYISEAECDLHSAKYICYDMFAALKRLPEPTVSYGADAQKGLNYTGLTDFVTIDEYFENYKEILSAKLAAVSDIPKSSRLSGQEIRDYIDQNFCSYDFQVSQMAEHFHITPQNMRKIFKEYCGLGITEYVTTLRIDKATELLKNTDLDIQTITESIGLSDVSGFIRLFKQKTGMTPGQYRRF